jgi:hypothetical protein
VDALERTGDAGSDLRDGRARYHRRVRKLIKIALVALGIRAFLRWRKRRRAEAELAAAPPPPPPDPADELRQKLAESRVDDAVDAAPDPQVTVEERRAEIHEQGRSAVDEMKSSEEA